jgi:uncharacterized DUF497 family protein
LRAVRSWRGKGGNWRHGRISFSVATIGVIIKMNIEWDDSKNRQNIKKHGIDFSDAWQLFENPLFVWYDDRYDYGEERYIGLGTLNNMMIVFMAFVEKDTDAIRVISMRKAKKHEREKYQKAITN